MHGHVLIIDMRVILVMGLISLFLFQFGTDVENVVNLVSLPQYLDLEEYGQKRLGKVCEYFLLYF